MRHGAGRRLKAAYSLALILLAGCGSRSSLEGFEGGLGDDAPGGGSASAGGAPTSGGAPGAGGSTVTGGAAETGGSTSSGGAPSTGGREGGSGGVPPTGGASSGGTGGQPDADGIDYLKSSFPRRDDGFGSSVALSADGRTLAVGVKQDSSAAIGINGDPSILGEVRTGAVFVYWHDGVSWTQQAYIKASDPDAHDYFGEVLSLSADGNRLAVGATGEDSSSAGASGDPSDDATPAAGAVYVFSRVGASWTQQAYLKPSNTDDNDLFGNDVALSPDGTTLAVGATGEDSAATGSNGDQTNETLASSGAVYVFFDSGSGWAQQAYLKASNTGAQDGFGTGLALSENGDTLVVAATSEASAATGIDGDQDDNTADYAGAVYVFSRAGADFVQTAYIKASNASSGQYFGFSVAISASGDTLAIAAPGEGSLSSGVNGDQTDASYLPVGAVYVFTQFGSSWQQEAYIKASNPQEAAFGAGLALSGNGESLLVGAYLESSGAAGIDGDQNDQSHFAAGAAYLFSRSASGWEQTAYIKASNPHEAATFGRSVALDYAGSTAVVCADGEHGSSPGINGDQSNQSTYWSGAAYVYYDLD